jgi:hypothetical protein
MYMCRNRTILEGRTSLVTAEEMKRKNRIYGKDIHKRKPRSSKKITCLINLLVQREAARD